MNRLGIALIIGALLFSALISGLIFKHHAKNANGANVPQVLVATHALARGTQIADADVNWQPWHAPLSPDYIVEGSRSKEDVVGAIVRTPINAGEPITDSLLIAKSSLSPLASVLAPGMRAYTINVTLASALGGFVLPGDAVDVILTFSQEMPGSANKIYESKTILRDITVLGVDESLTPAQAKSNSTKPSMSNNTRNVTLQVTPEEADLLATGAQMGTLSLSLTTPVNASMNSAPKPAQQETVPGITLIRGGKVDQLGKNGS